MNAKQLFRDDKSLSFPGRDSADAQFVAVRTIGYDNFNVTVFNGTLRVGHWSDYGSWYSNEDVDSKEYIQVVDTRGKTDAEIVREAIKRCDWWFAECVKRLAEIKREAEDGN